VNTPAPPIDGVLAEGEAHVHAGRFAQAEACVSHVLQRQPRNARAHYLRGLAALFQRRPADGIAPLEQALRTERVNPQLHFVMGLCLAGSDRVEEAIASYRRALQYRPQFFEALANLGNLYETHGRFDEAAEIYRRALALRPDEALVLNGLGLCEMSGGKFAEALPRLERAVALRGDFDSAMNNLATCLGKLGRNAEAVQWLQRAVELRPAFTEAWINLGEQLYIARRDAEAVAALDRALALDPGNEGVRYLRDAMAGVRVDRAPDAFVAGFFDRFANDFDRRLTQDLGYRTPQVAAEHLAPWLATRRDLRVLDLGCGTGLSGAIVREHARELVGVDLSEGMLEQARRRGIYDSLERSEIAAFLARRPPGSVDLAIALDVFVYVGNIEPVVTGCAGVLAPGGRFVFSVERLDVAGGDFALARTGRYAHARAYVERLAAAAGLAMESVLPTVIRTENGAPVQGDLYTLTRA
jgi:predicted TPR repeat methyltransferase